MGERLGDTALWVTVRDTAYRVLRRRGWTHEEADDAAQETALAMQRELEKGTEIRNPAAWAATVANRRAVQHDRKAHMPHAHEVDVRESIGRFLAEGAPTSAQAIQREQVGRLIEALDEKDLETAWLTAEGLEQAEIAELVGIGEEGVRQRLKRMRRRLRERADELGVDVEVLEHPRPY